MNTMPFWLLTTPRGQSGATPAAGSWWGRGVTHIHLASEIAGYCSDNASLPYLIDPLYERYGPSGRLWFSAVDSPRYREPNRVVSHAWTTLEEWPRPAWVGGPADRRTRLRFALLAAADTHPDVSIRARMRTLSLENLEEAGRQMSDICHDCRRHGLVPQAMCLAAMGIRAAARLEAGHPDPEDRPAQRYTLDAWYAATAAATTCVCLSHFAEEAVRRESEGDLVLAGAVAADSINGERWAWSR